MKESRPPRGRRFQTRVPPPYRLPISPTSDPIPVVLAYSTIPPVPADKQKTHRGYNWRWVALELINECWELARLKPLASWTIGTHVHAHGQSRPAACNCCPNLTAG